MKYHWHVRFWKVMLNIWQEHTKFNKHRRCQVLLYNSWFSPVWFFQGRLGSGFPVKQQQCFHEGCLSRSWSWPQCSGSLGAFTSTDLILSHNQRPLNSKTRMCQRKGITQTEADHHSQETLQRTIRSIDAGLGSKLNIRAEWIHFCCYGLLCLTIK